MSRISLVLIGALALLLTATGGSSARPGVCKPRSPDAALRVNGINVLDSDAVRRLVGENYKSVKTESDFPWSVYVSRDARQTLALRTHAGGTRFDFQEVEVKDLALAKPDVIGDDIAYYIGQEPRDQVLPVTVFTTASGIRLGMTRRFVTSRVGPCARVFKRRGPMETIRYELTDETHPVLKKAGMPAYYAEYQFRRGRLVRFRFGFDPV
jgi:hypothetical protein